MNFLFPSEIKCIFCGTDIPNPFPPYCEDCKKLLKFNTEHRCLICDVPIFNEAVICDHCQKEKRYFKKASCVFIYDGLIKKHILDFKENNKRYLAKSFAKLMHEKMQEEGISFDIVTFVPLTTKKKKLRSFNQSELLAKEIAKLSGSIVLDMFEKTSESDQKALNFKERKESTKNLYVLKKDLKIKIHG